MKIDFPINTTTLTNYCATCHHTLPVNIKPNEGGHYICTNCDAINSRIIIIDPTLQWWLDDQQTYYHASAGILLFNRAGEVLVFDLAKFPYGLTIPAGHIDNGETPEQAIIRETREEINVDISQPTLVKETLIHNDKCRRGCDDHYWYLYTAPFREDQEYKQNIRLDASEGKAVHWIKFEELKSSKNLAPAIKHLFTHFGHDIEKSINFCK